MQQTAKPASKAKVVLLWTLFLGSLALIFAFFLWQTPKTTPAAEGTPDALLSVVLLFFAGFFLVAGAVSYLIVLFTQCFTFNFQRPVWNGLKGKLYLANIFVSLMPALGLGLGLSAVLSPTLSRMGMGTTVANMVPVFAMIALLQIAQLWVQIWAPLERRVIARRLIAQGITPEQLQDAILVGISDPLRSSFKKLTMVEDDIGALWISPERLVYYGDMEQFALTREQLVQLERRADTGGTTMLFGITHVILHVRLAEGSERQIRLHTEGLLTMGRKREAMDVLTHLITQWHASARSTPPPVPRI